MRTIEEERQLGERLGVHVAVIVLSSRRFTMATRIGSRLGCEGVEALISRTAAPQ